MAEAEAVRTSRVQRALDAVERVGNKLPDPAALFIGLLFIVWICSWLFSYVDYEVIDPRSGEKLVVINQLSGDMSGIDGLFRVSNVPSFALNLYPP